MAAPTDEIVTSIFLPERSTNNIAQTLADSWATPTITAAVSGDNVEPASWMILFV